MPSRRARTSLRGRKNKLQDRQQVSSLKFKICLIGDGAVGKTALRKRFMGEGFRSSYMFTVGADFAVKEIMIKDEETKENISVKFQIWDLAGQPKFKEVRKSFYNGAKGALVVFDVTNPTSFNNIPHWVEELWMNNGSGKIPFILVGNKIDLAMVAKDYIDKKTVNVWKEKFEKMHDVTLPYIETSAKTGENVEQAFHTLARFIREHIKKKPLTS